MKAIVYTEFGPPDVLKLAERERPTPKAHEVLIKVRAASVNPLDWHLLRGEPYPIRLMGRPGVNGRIPGVDVAGQVEEVGANVAQFHPGDDVFGARTGAFAEYVCGSEIDFALKPAGLTYEQAAAIPVAACTALQGLREHGRLQPGQSVLINGAAGGVGTFAVQIAKALGAYVTGVCSTRNVDMVRSIGADHVVDYTAEDFVRSERRYDLILNVAGNRSLADVRRALAAGGTLVVVGGGVGREENSGGRALEVLTLMIAGKVLSRFMRPRSLMFMAKVRKSDLLFLTVLIDAGKLTPVVDRAYPLTDAASAIRYLEAGHARGKVIVTM